MIKVSIITINYNNVEGLKNTLASVAAQTYANIQHIIVDGGSTDGSVEIIRGYADNQCKVESVGCKGTENIGADESNNDSTQLYTTLHNSTLQHDSTPIYTTLHNSTPPKHNVLWVSEPDKGIYNAMNKGIEIALGKRIVNDNHTSSLIASSPYRLIASDEYIQILNAGDVLSSADVTESMMNFLDTQKRYSNSIGILYGNMIKRWPNGKQRLDKCLGDRVSVKTENMVREIPWTMYDFIKGTINHDPTYIHYSLYEKYGLYDESLRIVSDWKWFVNAVVFGNEKVYYTPINVTIFDMTGISETNLEEREKERHAELEKILPIAILKDYDSFHFPIEQYKRLKKYHIWRIVYFIERVLFKLEKWNVLKR